MTDTGGRMTHQLPFSFISSPSNDSSDYNFIENDVLESVLASAEVGVWQLFSDGQSFVVTPTTYSILGIADDERPDSCEQWLSLVHPADLDRVAGELERLKLRTGPFTLEAQVRADETESQWIEIRGRTLHDETGAFAGACGTIQDVTHRKEPEVFRDLLLATLSHDLRDPLSAIQIGTSLLLRREHLEQKGIVTAKRVMASARRISAMVDQVLDFSRLRVRGTLPCNRRLTSLGVIATAVVEEMELAYPGRRIDIFSEGDLEGEWDADRLARMIANLISNGLLHGDPSAPVTVRVTDRGRDTLVVVHNMGPAIPAGDFATIFDPFRRRSRRRTSGGLGLGLFIAHEIVRSHGGKIWVTSSPGAGTEFSALLPRQIGYPV